MSLIITVGVSRAVENRYHPELTAVLSLTYSSFILVKACFMHMIKLANALQAQNNGSENRKKKTLKLGRAKIGKSRR